MAKKKGGKKKSDSGKAPLQKLESRLLGYWKRESWGEFVTLFQRHWAKSQKTQAAAYWDAAVYNLLLSSLFESQDHALLQHIVHELIDHRTISGENQKCLQTATVFLALYNGQTGPEAVHALPSDLPPPFARLAEAMQDICQSSSTSLAEYVQGKRTRARKGEKHLALVAKIGKQFNTLREKDFQPASIQPYTQLRKSLRDLLAEIQNQLDSHSPIVNNMAILADYLRTMYSRPGDLNNPAQAIKNLHDKGFVPSTHPAVEGLACAFLILGRKRLGTEWEQAMRVSFRRLLPGLAPELPGHIEQQLQALNQVAQQDLYVTRLIPALLRYDVWSSRERMLLLLAHLYVAASGGEQILEHLEDLMEGASSEKQVIQAINQHIVLSTNTLKQVIDLYAQFGFQDSSLLDHAVQQWQEAVVYFPFLHCVKDLDELLVTMSASPVSDASLLVPIMKRVEHATTNVHKIKSVKTVQKNRAPLHVSEQGLRMAVNTIDVQSDLENIFSVWEKFFELEDYQQLVNLFLHRVFVESCKEQPSLSFFFHDPSFDWEDIPESLIHKFARILPSESPLYGLVLLSAKKDTTDCPMPKNAGEARCFLDHLPPPEMLDDMLEWMFTWPTTPYRNTFLAAVIGHNAEYITQNNGWLPLARKIQRNRLTKLAELVCDIWHELGLFSRLKNNHDFRAASEVLQAMAQRGKKSRSSSSGGKKRTLLDEVLEEKKKKSQKNNG